MDAVFSFFLFIILYFLWIVPSLNPMPSPDKSDRSDVRMAWCLFSIQRLQNGRRYSSLPTFTPQISSSVSEFHSLLSQGTWIKKISQAFGSLFLRRLSITFAFEQCHFLLEPLLLFSMSTFIWRSPLITCLHFNLKASHIPPLRLHHPRILLWNHLVSTSSTASSSLSIESILYSYLAAPSSLSIESISEPTYFTRIVSAFYLQKTSLSPHFAYNLKVSPRPIRTALSSLSIESITESNVEYSSNTSISPATKETGHLLLTTSITASTTAPASLSSRAFHPTFCERIIYRNGWIRVLVSNCDSFIKYTFAKPVL